MAETCRERNKTDTKTVLFDVPTPPSLIYIKHNGDVASKDVGMTILSKHRERLAQRRGLTPHKA